MSESVRSPVRVSALTTVLAARRCFVDPANKSEIAGDLGISRFKVARLLQDALRAGIVRIEVDPVPEVDDVLSGGRVYALHVPLILQRAEVADAMRSDPNLN